MKGAFIPRSMQGTVPELGTEQRLLPRMEIDRAVDGSCLGVGEGLPPGCSARGMPTGLGTDKINWNGSQLVDPCSHSNQSKRKPRSICPANIGHRDHQVPPEAQVYA